MVNHFQTGLRNLKPETNIRMVHFRLWHKNKHFALICISQNLAKITQIILWDPEFLKMITMHYCIKHVLFLINLLFKEIFSPMILKKTYTYSGLQ